MTALLPSLACAAYNLYASALARSRLVLAKNRAPIYGY
jgi:hypothetical protein